jgi:hypothetical protein
MAEEKLASLDEKFEASSLPNSVSEDLVNDILLEIKLK